MDSAKTNWGWLLALGILFVILGVIGLGMSVGLTLVSMVFFGVLLIIAGIAQFVYVFQYKDWAHIIWQLVIGIFYVLGGCAIIYDPLLASIVITAFLAAVFVIMGITRVITALTLKANPKSSRIWLVIAGLVSLFLGIVLFSQWPSSALWFIGLFIAIEMIMSGWSYIIFALAVRR